MSADAEGLQVAPPAVSLIEGGAVALYRYPSRQAAPLVPSAARRHAPAARRVAPVATPPVSTPPVTTSPPTVSTPVYDAVLREQHWTHARPG